MFGSRVLKSLPLGSAAYPVLHPDEQRFAFEQGDRITLADARAFLASEGVHSELRARFGTSAARRRLRHALDVFDDRLSQWLAGRRQSSRVRWLIPLGGNSEALICLLYRALLERDDYASFCALHQLLRLPRAPRWTPFVSVESIRLVRSLTRHKQIRLERAFKCAGASIGIPPSLRPWNAESLLISALPTSWLFQFEPHAELGALIDRASRAGLYNVGHFAILDPSVRRTTSPMTVSAVRAAVAMRGRLDKGT